MRQAEVHEGLAPHGDSSSGSHFIGPMVETKSLRVRSGLPWLSSFLPGNSLFAWVIAFDVCKWSVCEIRKLKDRVAMKDVSLVKMDSEKTSVSMAALGREALSGLAPLGQGHPASPPDSPLCRRKDRGWPAPGPTTDLSFLVLFLNSLDDTSLLPAPEQMLTPSRPHHLGALLGMFWASQGSLLASLTSECAGAPGNVFNEQLSSW